MTPERKERIAKLRQKLANLTPEQKQELTNRGIITTIEGRAMSINNTLLLYLQANGTIPTIVGGYNQWKAAGRQVSKGVHGFTIWFPVGNKDKETGDILSAERFFTGTVFDISQTELIGTQPTPTPTPEPQPVTKHNPIMEEKNIMEGWALV